jgi:uncharacterized protein YjbI with pentapeptide repeats
MRRVIALVPVAAVLLLGVIALAGSAAAADLTVRQITEILMHATPADPADLSDKDLSRLDLSGLDFSGAHLARADLTASDLSDANFSRSDLVGARLDLTVIIRADFAGADLRHASLMRPAVSSTLQAQAEEAPRFAGANLEGAQIFARLTYADFGGARLVNARLGTDARTVRTMNLGRSELSGCNLLGADLAGADLRGVLLSFANLSGAILTNTNLQHADLSHADLTQADLDGADLSGADLDRVVLKDARSLARAIGLQSARHYDPTSP